MQTVAALARAGERFEREFGRITLPLLILHGTADKATRPDGSHQFHDEAGSADKELKLYEGHYHDLLNDFGREQVIDGYRRLDRGAPPAAGGARDCDTSTARLAGAPRPAQPRTSPSSASGLSSATNPRRSFELSCKSAIATGASSLWRARRRGPFRRPELARRTGSSNGRARMEKMELHRGRLIDHIQLVVADVAASRRFYEAVFDVLDDPDRRKRGRAFLG